MSQFHGGPVPPQQPGPFQPAPKTSKPKRWVPWVGGGLVGLLAGLIFGTAGDTSANDAAEYASTHPVVTKTAPGVEVTVTPPPVVKTVLKPGPTVKVTEKPAEAAATIDEGTWEVGVDVAPGRYKTTAAVDAGGMCYWKITTTGKPDNIVDNDIVTGGRPTVTIKKGQDFTTQDCGTWTKVG